MSTPAIELLTVDDIAKLYKVEIHTARDKIIKTPGFPDPAPGSTLRLTRAQWEKVRMAGVPALRLLIDRWRQKKP